MKFWAIFRVNLAKWSSEFPQSDTVGPLSTNFSINPYLLSPCGKLSIRTDTSDWDSSNFDMEFQQYFSHLKLLDFRRHSTVQSPSDCAKLMKIYDTGRLDPLHGLVWNCQPFLFFWSLYVAFFVSFFHLEAGFVKLLSTVVETTRPCVFICQERSLSPEKNMT